MTDGLFGRNASRSIVPVSTVRSRPERPLGEHADEVSVEEPLEIRIAGETYATTMRTPGSDHELVAGFLLAEGLIRDRADLGGIAHCGRPDQEGWGNVIDVSAAPGTVLDVEALGRTRRGTLTHAACGVCGRQLVDDLLLRLAPAPSGPGFTRSFIAQLPLELRRQQPQFERTGGLHAAGIATLAHGIELVREDVGRHNAVDKVLGRLLLDARLREPGLVLTVSGRISFELVQKAVSAGVSALVGVSAPSSLAIATALRFGLLLCGFTRGGGFNAYAGAERLLA